MMGKTYTFKLLYIYDEREKAICVSGAPHAPYKDRFWLPKSQIEYDESWAPGDQIEVKIPDWLLERIENDDRE